MAEKPPVLPQWYSGVKFRSSLEARWAVFFDHAGIGWEYEPEGFVIAGQPYRPDFLLNSGTWIEVKGDPARLDVALMRAAAIELPRVTPKYEQGPPLMLLGGIPAPREDFGDWGWIGLNPEFPSGDDPMVVSSYYGFGIYTKNYRPWWLEGDFWSDVSGLDSLYPGKVADHLLTPVFDELNQGIPEAYAAARAHRFGRR